MKLFLASSLLVAFSCLLGASQAQAASPFWGITPIDYPSVEGFATLGKAQVGTLRPTILWRDVEPAPDQYKWYQFDYLVASSAEQGMDILPFFHATPQWAATGCATPEECATIAPVKGVGRTAWQDFLADAAARYGTNGSFWSDTSDSFNPPYHPVRFWQIWNEPSSPTYWRNPSAKSYAKLLKSSNQALAAVDPEAQIVAAGLFDNLKGRRTNGFMETLLEVKGIEKAFDVAALHPYASTVGGLAREIKQFRAVMKKGGAKNTPLWITEMAWGSDNPTPGSDQAVGLEGQSALMGQAFQLLSANQTKWRLQGVVWFGWQDPGYSMGVCKFCDNSGLFTPEGTPKPSLGTFLDFTGGLF